MSGSGQVTCEGSTEGRLVIVGAGGHAREALDVVEAINAAGPSWEVLGLVASDWQQAAAPDGPLARRRTEALGDLDVLEAMAGDDVHYIVAIGDSAVRAAIVERLDRSGLRAATLVHPQAQLGSDLTLGPGVIVAAGAHLTTNVVVGRHTHCNVASVLSHDVVAGAFVTVSPGVLVNGAAHLGDGAFLGTGAVVIPGRRVGARAVVGAGAVVIDDVPDGTTVVGVPARPAG